MILNNTVRAWAFTVVLIISAAIFLRLVQMLVIKRLKKSAEKTKTEFDDFIVRQLQLSVMPFLYLLSVYICIHTLDLTPKAQNIARIALLIIIVFFSLKIVNAVISYTFRRLLVKNHENKLRASKGIVLILRAIIALAALLFVIDNLGYDITTLITGLGIGGIAIALASQTVLADVFSYLAIYFDKPFEPGDFIVLDDKMGTVDYIGIRTTRLKTLSGEQLICSNADLTNARVHNYKRMQERRLEFRFGIEYDTSLEKLKAIPKWVRIIIESIPKTRFERAHFKSFDDSSLQFEVVYTLKSPDYNEYMNVQQEINLLLIDLFNREAVSFAFPTQKVLWDSQRK